MSASNLQHALTLLQQNAVDDATAVLKETIDDIPAHAAAHVLLARAYEAQKKWEEALHAWEQAHFLVPTSPTATEGKQRVLRRLAPTAPKPEASPKSSSSAGPSPETEPAASRSEPDEEEPSPPHSSSAADALSELERLRREAETERPREEEHQESPASSTVDASSKDADVPPELEQLRRMAEAEARRGGPRGGMQEDVSSSGESSPDDEDRSGLEQLRRQAEAEARRGGARGGITGGPSSSEDSKTEPQSSPSEGAPSSSGSNLNEDFGELDRLIEELESAHIAPTPNPTDAPEPETMDVEEEADDRADDLVSETLARIYASQGKYREAMRAYLKLAAKKPDQTRTFLEKASQMRVKAEANED